MLGWHQPHTLAKVPWENFFLQWDSNQLASRSTEARHDALDHIAMIWGYSIIHQLYFLLLKNNNTDTSYSNKTFMTTSGPNKKHWVLWKKKKKFLVQFLFVGIHQIYYLCSHITTTRQFEGIYLWCSGVDPHHHGTTAYCRFDRPYNASPFVPILCFCLPSCSTLSIHLMLSHSTFLLPSILFQSGADNQGYVRTHLARTGLPFRHMPYHPGCNIHMKLITVLLSFHIIYLMIFITIIMKINMFYAIKKKIYTVKPVKLTIFSWNRQICIWL